jgi:hypothetical protein
MELALVSHHSSFQFRNSLILETKPACSVMTAVVISEV